MKPILELLKNKLKFTNTIRFKLTLIYSLFSFLFVSFVVVSINLYLNNYLQSEPPIRKPARMWVKEVYPISGTDDFIVRLEENEIRTIREIRLHDLKEIQRMSILSIFPLAILSFCVGYILSGKFLKPISNLQSEISLLKREDLGKTIPVESEDEVGKLIESFNDLSLRLKNSFDSQDRFVQDAQHELKTPLTIIYTNLDTVLDDPDASKVEMREAMANSLTGIKMMKSLTNYLLDLTMPAEAQKKEIEINELVEKQVNLLKVFADSLKVKLSFGKTKKEIKLKSNEITLERAIFNIMENAIKYSAGNDKSEVKVSIHPKGKLVLIEIEDNGPGIPKELHNKIFERFYRVDKSRNRKTGGFGLGLAIAKKFIEDNQGRITLESEPGKTVFRLTFFIKN